MEIREIMERRQDAVIAAALAERQRLEDIRPARTDLERITGYVSELEQQYIDACNAYDRARELRRLMNEAEELVRWTMDELGV